MKTEAEERAYSQGYAAGLRRVKELSQQLRESRRRVKELESVKQADPHDATIAYLIRYRGGGITAS